MLHLNASPFTEGGHRAIYIHPHDPSKCIKILLDHSTSEKKKASAPFFKKHFRRLEKFDENLEELSILTHIENVAPEIIGLHIPKCYGFEETDRGRGLVTDVYRDFDNKISINLRDYILSHKTEGGLTQAIEEFQTNIFKYKILSRALLLHNIVVKRLTEESCQLFLIDGIGSSEFIPISSYLPVARDSKIKRKIELMNKHIGYTLSGTPF